MSRLWLGSVLAGVVLMIWGFVSWGVLAGALDVVRPVPGEMPVAQALDDAIPEDGTYFLPWEGMAGTEEEKAAWAARHAAGPVAFLFVRANGVESNMPKVMLTGFVHFILSAFLAGLILQRAAPALATYGARVGLVTLVGTFMAFAMGLSPSIWWYVPWSYGLFLAITAIVGWFLAGLVLARFVKA
jgi:hypothetical protein